MIADPSETIVLGGGLAGLSAAAVFARAGRPVCVLEAADAVGGLARTIAHRGFRFDLGGHRFHTPNREVEAMVRGLLGHDLLTVRRSSKIMLRGCSFDYPLQPLNALIGMGIPAILRALAGYAAARARKRLRGVPILSLEDWVVLHYGRPLHELFFRDYSEKVWGIPCERIAQEWIAQRIQGLSLGAVIGRAFFKRAGERLPTLADEFLYPRLGIGSIAQGLKARIESNGSVLTDARVTAIRHAQSRLRSVTVRHAGNIEEIRADSLLSTIPLPRLVQLLHPEPPAEVLEAASRLRYRDLVVVAVMLDRPRVTDLTWLYLPDTEIPFGRVHEPTNWSPHMAPPGKTLLVAEHFCFRADAVWGASDGQLVATTVSCLERLGLISRREVIDSVVQRISAAYPLFEIGYRERCETLIAYLRRFSNLDIAGRGGMFRYYNMDSAIDSGIAAAETMLAHAPRRPADIWPMPVRRRA